jgi:hypothetical protein
MQAQHCNNPAEAESSHFTCGWLEAMLAQPDIHGPGRGRGLTDWRDFGIYVSTCYQAGTKGAVQSRLYGMCPGNSTKQTNGKQQPDPLRIWFPDLSRYFYFNAWFSTNYQTLKGQGKGRNTNCPWKAEVLDLTDFTSAVRREGRDENILTQQWLSIQMTKTKHINCRVWKYSNWSKFTRDLTGELSWQRSQWTSNYPIRNKEKTRKVSSWVWVMAYVCNPSYSGGKDERTVVQSQTREKVSKIPYEQTSPDWW